MVEISNRTVFIVGGTSGIRRGLAQRFADAGRMVVVGGRSTGRAASVTAAGRLDAW